MALGRTATPAGRDSACPSESVIFRGRLLNLLPSGICPLALLFFTRSHEDTGAGAAGVWQDIW